MKIAIHGRPLNDESVPHVQEMLDHLMKHKTELLIYSSFNTILEKKHIKTGNKTLYNNPDELKGVDFIISVGGDGTLLETVTYVGEKEIPILGINTGRLGFLATTPREKVKKAISALFKGDFLIDERTLIRLDSNEDLFAGVNFGLNEFTILKRDSSSMIVVHTYIDGEYLNSYWADGLIVSTPTGSTGYSLSCGGPLVMPHSNNFIISPVSPHNLNVRPMVVSDKSEISFEVEGRSRKILVSLDSRSKSVPSHTKMKVRKEDFKVKLVELKEYKYLETLRSKLNWGLDLRN